MARAYICDRCGTYFNKLVCGNLYSVSIKGHEISKDLCPKCCRELDNWMENKANFVPKEEIEDYVQQDV